MSLFGSDLLYDSLGLLGTACFLTAYILLQTERIDPKRTPYSVMNLAGAVLILLSLLHSFNLAAFLLETAWGIISLYGVIKSMKAAR